jgi:hypothetical protein
VLVSCKSHKKIATDAKLEVKKGDLISSVKDNAQTGKFITSKVKFSIEVGVQKLTLTGNLKMKRDECIRLQLMAFGFVEAGRIELTPDYVLIMDRINKQYMKASYGSVDFLRNSGLNFYTMQALFWNELFVPGQSKVTDNLLNRMDADLSGEDAIISLNDGKMQYRWLATKDKATIRMANIIYSDQFNGNTQLNWDYVHFTTLENGNKQFPDEMNVMLTTKDKEIKLGMKLNYVKHESEWETRTEVSNKYREVTIDEILKRFMAL